MDKLTQNGETFASTTTTRRCVINANADRRGEAFCIRWCKKLSD